MSKKSDILVVEDSLESLSVLGELLAAEGYLVRPASSGELALASAAAAVPDLVLLDQRMPGMDGLEVFRRLRQAAATAKVPVIFLTGVADPKPRIEALALGAADFIAKPFDRAELLARIKNQLLLGELRSSLERQARELTTSNLRLSALWGVAELAARPPRDSYFQVLKAILTMTDSPYGFLGVLTKNGLGLTVPAWAGKVMEDCSIPGAPKNISLETDNLMSRAVRAAKPLILNDYAGSPGAGRRFPEGHVPLKSILLIPIIKDGRPRLLAGVANKPGGYAEEDIAQVSSFLTSLQAQLDLQESRLREHRLAAELQQERDRLSALIDGMEDEVWMTDRSGRLILANKTAVEHFGALAQDNLPASEVAAAAEVYRPDGTPRSPEDSPHLKALREGRTVEVEETVRLPATGAWRSRLVVSSLVRNADQELLGVVSVVHDITARKARESRQALSLAVLKRLGGNGGREDAVRDILLAIKETLGIEAVAIRLKEGADYPYFVANGFPERFLAKERFLCSQGPDGCPVKDASGNPLLECMCGIVLEGRTDPSQPFFTKGGSFWTNCTTDLLASTTPGQRQARTRNRCNSEGYESVALVPLLSNNAIIGLLQLNDHRKGILDLELVGFLEGLGASIGLALEKAALAGRQTALEDQLRQAQKMESVGRLAGGVAHDFNNLLTAITGYASCLRDSLDPGDPRQEDVREILSAGERAATLTRQLLAFSRKQILNPKTVDLNAAVGGTVRMLKRLIGEDIRLETRLWPEPCLVTIDVGQIDQVLMNLAVNSRDAMPRGGTLTVATDAVAPDDCFLREHPGFPSGLVARIRVSDTGCGMSEETRKQVFEPFFTTKARGRGTGLGLSMVYGLVKQSGGEIEIASAPGRGTTVTISLPMVSAEQSSKEDGPAPGSKTLKGSETILVVEDEDIVRRLASRALKDAGYTVLDAPNGAEALLALERHGKPVSLLVTDVVMPGMHGRALALAAAAKKLAGRTLFMSGYTDDAIVEHGVLEEGLAFIYKPFSPEAFLRKVREVLDGPADKAHA